MDVYNRYFQKKGYIAGQILLTQEDFNDRRRFLNIRYTLNTLLKFKAVPIINENDSISTEEIKCGDNDRLSYLVSDLASSDLLVILTDVEGLFDDKGLLVEEVGEITDSVRSFCGGKGSETSTGGMITKLEAISNATSSGIECVIARGRRENVLLDILEGKDVGTRFKAAKVKMSARKRWIAYGIKPKGKVIVDQGAARAVTESKKSLLPSGITDVEGKFSDGDVVDIVAAGGGLVARGITSYSSEEIRKIKGLKTDRIEEVLGYKDYDEVIHRDNLVVIESE
jgi:glutamate 5-kinase